MSFDWVWFQVGVRGNSPREARDEGSTRFAWGQMLCQLEYRLLCNKEIPKHTALNERECYLSHMKAQG